MKRAAATFAALAWGTVLTMTAGGHAPALAAGATEAAPLFAQPPATTPNFTGKWLNVNPQAHLLAAGGAEPPLNASGKAEYARRQAALHHGDRNIDPISSCLLHGIPRLLYTPLPFLILQTTRDVNFIHEANHTFRNIYWDRPPGEEPDPTYLGSAVAHFVGRTLVIDSTGFNDLTWLDYSGLPHGAKLTVEERYTLQGPDTIQGDITLTDPDFYTAPWTTHVTFRRQPGMSLRENVCMDTHRM